MTGNAYTQCTVADLRMSDIGANIILIFNGAAMQGWLRSIHGYTIAQDRKTKSDVKPYYNIEVVAKDGDIRYRDMPEGFLVQIER